MPSKETWTSNGKLFGYGDKKILIPGFLIRKIETIFFYKHWVAETHLHPQVQVKIADGKAFSEGWRF